MMAIHIYLPTLPPYAISLGASLTLVGFISGSFGLAHLLLRIPFGLISDRWQRRRIFVLLGAFAASGSGLGFFLSSDPKAFVLWRALAGIGGATVGLNAVLFAEHFSQATKAMGVFNFTVSLALAVGPITGGLLANLWGWRAPFLAGGILGLISLIAAALVWEPCQSVKPSPYPKPLLAELLKRPLILQAILLMALLTFSQNATIFTFVPVKAYQLGASQSQLGVLIFLAMLIVSLISLLSGSVFAQRVDTRWVASIGFAFVGISSLFIPPMIDLPGLTLSVLFCGIGWGMILPILGILSINESPAGTEATAIGVYLAGGSIGVFLGPFLGGWFADLIHPNAPFLIVGITCLLTSVWQTTQAMKICPAKEHDSA
jgi:MFS family permease